MHARHNHVPQAQQVVQVAAELVKRAADGRRADDHAHALGHRQRIQDAPQRVALRVVLDLARDAALVAVGHQHHVAAGQAQVGAQAGALAALARLRHLHQHFLVALEQVLDFGQGAAHEGARLVAALARCGLAVAVKVAPGLGGRLAAVRHGGELAGGAGFLFGRRRELEVLGALHGLEHIELRALLARRLGLGRVAHGLVLVDDAGRDVRQGLSGLGRAFKGLGCLAVVEHFGGGVGDVVAGADLGELVEEFGLAVALGLGFRLGLVIAGQRRSAGGSCRR